MSRKFPKEIPVINLTPLIDVLFTVLMFLVLTANFTKLTAINIKLPGATTGENLEKGTQALRIDIHENGVIMFEERPISLASLRQLIEQTSPERNIQLAIDRRTAHGRVVKVIDQLRHQGRFQFEMLTVDR